MRTIREVIQANWPNRENSVESRHKLLELVDYLRFKKGLTQTGIKSLFTKCLDNSVGLADFDCEFEALMQMED